MKKSWSRKRTESKWLLAADGFSPHSSSPRMKKSTSTIPKVFISIHQKEKSVYLEITKAVWDAPGHQIEISGFLARLMWRMAAEEIMSDATPVQKRPGHNRQWAFRKNVFACCKRTQTLIVSYYRNKVVFPSCIWKKTLRVLNHWTKKSFFETSLWSLGKLWWLYLTLCRLNEKCLFWRRFLWIIS